METMQLLLLTVVLTLASEEQLSYNYQEEVTVNKLLGKWYINRWAGNMPVPEKKKFSPLPPFTFVKNIIGKLEFRMNISKPIGCIEFKIYLNEVKGKPGIFYIWPDHRIVFVFVHGKDFVIAIYVNNADSINHTMTMLMGRHMAPGRRTRLDFESIVQYLGLNRTDIINPRCDDSCNKT